MIYPKSSVRRSHALARVSPWLIALASQVAACLAGGTAAAQLAATSAPAADRNNPVNQANPSFAPISQAGSPPPAAIAQSKAFAANALNSSMGTVSSNGISSATSTPYNPALYGTAAAQGGGPILQPNIIPIFWGPANSNWSSLQTTMQQYLASLAVYTQGMASPQAQEPTIHQYGVIGAILSPSYVDTNVSTNKGAQWHTTRAGVQTEIVRLQGAGLVPKWGPENLFMVFTNGITFDDGYGQNPPNGWGCGIHLAAGVSEYYSVNPFPSASICDPTGLGPWGVNQIWEAQTSHEFQEAATDPTAFATGLPNGWWIPGVPNNPNDPGGAISEIGDPCNWAIGPGTNIISVPVEGVAIPIQSVVDTLQNTCSVFTIEQASPISASAQAVGGSVPTSVGLDAVVEASNHSIWQLSQRIGTWGSWTPVTSEGLNTGSAPVLIASGGTALDGSLDAFMVAPFTGTANLLWHAHYTGTTSTTAGV